VVSEQVWAFWDLMPTLAELTGQSPPPNTDGVSILPALVEGRPVAHPPLYFEFHERGFTVAARRGDWKAVRLGPRQPIELYEMKADAAEQHDVAAQHPDIVRRFEEYLKTARTESELWPIRENGRKAAAPKSAEEKEQ
jgi:arylsulfatase A-like enzyme